jgi:flagellar basal body-associated protein FliL
MYVRKEKDRGTDSASETKMPLLIISIPLMVLFTAVAVIPLIVLSHREHQRHAVERAAARITPASTTAPPAHHTASDKLPVAA